MHASLIINICFLRFNLRNVTAVGLIGIYHLDGNFVTNNINLKYFIDEIDIHTKYPGISGKKVYSQISKTNIGKNYLFTNNIANHCTNYY